MKKRLVDQIASTVSIRREIYGPPKSNMHDIALIWSVIFANKLNKPFTSTDVAQAMRLVKECRLKHSPDHMDSLKDIIGYVDVAESCLEEF